MSRWWTQATALLAGPLVLLTACERAREVRGRIVDAAGQPLPGAIFYIEAHAHGRAVDFAWVAAGRDGRFPATGEAAPAVRAPAGSRFTLVALAQHKKPAVLMDRSGDFGDPELLITLEDWPEAGARWEPRIGILAYPFEDSPTLAARVRQPVHAPLRRAFRAAYEPLADPAENPLPRELARKKIVDGLASGGAAPPP